MTADIIPLRAPIDIHSDIGRAFIIDATRAGEGLLADKELQEIYDLSPADWQSIIKDTALGKAIRTERDRRVRTGIAAREAAAKHFVKAPGILAGIMENAASNPRHVIEAAKEIRQVAAGNSDDGPTSQGDKISIVINLGSDVGDRIERTFDVTPNKAKQLELDLEGGKSDADKW